MRLEHRASKSQPFSKNLLILIPSSTPTNNWLGVDDESLQILLGELLGKTGKYDLSALNNEGVDQAGTVEVTILIE